MSTRSFTDPAEQHPVLRLFYRNWHPTRIGRSVNRVQGWLAGMGAPPSYQVLLEVRGRASGQLRSNPVAIATVDGERYLVSMLGPDSDWVKNVEAAHGEAVLRHGRRQRVQLVAVPPAERAPVLREYVRIAPSGRQHFPVRVSAPLAQFAAIAANYPVYRITTPVSEASVKPNRRLGSSPFRYHGLQIEGTTSPSFAVVRRAFIENFTKRGELGGACCIYQEGEKVVDLWAGVTSKEQNEPWNADTMGVLHSTTKGLAAMVMALAHSRGWLDYDARIASYWPEFAQHDKGQITVRQLLAHQAGLFAFTEHVDRSVVADLDWLAAIMARQRPQWPAGERQAYHAISLGFYENELIRRVDPAHRTLGQVFDQEIARPLELDAYIRIPQAIPSSRIARLELPSLWERLSAMPLPLLLRAFDRRSVLYRSLVANPGTTFYLDAAQVLVRELEVPSGGGAASARALAKVYGVFANGGHELGLGAETMAALQAEATPSRHGFYDECLGAPVRFSLGFMRPNESIGFGHPGAFGAPGFGGSMGYADPALRLGYGYVTSRAGARLQGDPRDVALRNAIP